MIVRWFGQSAFLLTGSKRVLIDPFGALGERLAERGITFRHPPVEGVSADLVLVTSRAQRSQRGRRRGGLAGRDPLHGRDARLADR